MRYESVLPCSSYASRKALGGLSLPVFASRSNPLAGYAKQSNNRSLALVRRYR
ncbi:MAG: hypothetical protein LC746_08695 [Acidobacteria bacterium]|nr:hypothetical protein [Acidobacteriota bacterium]